jgi:hypothetical protein
VTNREAGGRVGTLRGAGVEVDARRVGRVVVIASLVALAVLVVVLFAAGADKNAQITRLRQHGVRVEVTVSGCLGLLGGSGSNAAGYACNGTFTLDGHRYSDAIPGNTLYRPGTTVRAVTDPSDPGLLSTAAVVANEHPSSTVFILPACLLLVLALLVGAVLRRWRRTSRAPPPRQSVGRA